MPNTDLDLLIGSSLPTAIAETSHVINNKKVRTIGCYDKAAETKRIKQIKNPIILSEKVFQEALINIDCKEHKREKRYV